jgi:hypothetical protein
MDTDRTGKKTLTDRNSDTKGQGQGHKRKVIQMGRDRNTDGQSEGRDTYG